MDEDNNEDEDHAMFTKKPLGGLSCASCEKKIQNLSLRAGQHTQWKKMPMRDPMDRLAKAGQGFSRMLQSIKNPNDLSEEEIEQRHSVIGNVTNRGMGSDSKLKLAKLVKDESLPKIVNK